MKTELSPYQARVIGCLLEKELTTPDQYPLSLNALRSAVNQKSNRDPVLDLEETQVQQVVDELMKLHLISDRAGYGGGRVTKYKHRFCNTEFGAFKLNEQELAIVCVLLLRGAQTPGELRTRTNRLCDFRDVGEVEAVLHDMLNREDGPLVAKLAREPGRRESRYVHLFGTDAPSMQSEAARSAIVAEPVDIAEPGRLAALEEEIGALQREIARIKSALGMDGDTEP
ncbi:MAG: DUF480 domain-containing protein [Gammaproteobacteria bacterium]|nr:DUF480 domain-containing protein [Gammaproteobacteria bacterium]